MEKTKHVMWLLFFATLWGAGEVFAGGALYGANVPRASVWLTVWAFFILAVARGMLNIPGSSIAIAVLASVYRLVNAAPFFCHIGGIFFTGFAFDLIATLLMRRESRTLTRSISGVAASYSGHALFALVVTYVVGYEYWALEGLAKVIDHIFVNGSIVALAATVIVPFGYWTGKQGMNRIQRYPLWVHSCLVLFLIGLWTLGQLVQ